MMPERDYEAVEAWAMRSKLRAFLFLLGLGAFISSGLFAGASLLAAMVRQDKPPALAAHTR